MSLKKNVIERINDLIVKALEEGTQPWKKTWTDIKVNGREIFSPMNPVTDNVYKGVNSWLLSMHPGRLPLFLTFNQVKAKKGMIKKGAKSLPVIYFDVRKVERNGIEEERPFMRYYNVFNIEDTNLDVSEFTEGVSQKEELDLSNLDPILKTYLDREKIKVKFSLAGNKYIPGLDEIHMRDEHSFESREEYYSTFIHEIIHSTGHKSRLNRAEKNRAKPHVRTHEDYAFEELVAETGACYLANHLGYSNYLSFDNSTAYIKSWLQALNDDPYFFYQAAKQAHDAAEFVLLEYRNQLV